MRLPKNPLSREMQMICWLYAAGGAWDVAVVSMLPLVEPWMVATITTIIAALFIYKHRRSRR